MKIYILILAVVFSTWNVLAEEPKKQPPVPGQESHGADAFEIGGQLQLFDKLEHQKSFKPLKYVPYSKYLAPILKRMKELLPRTGRHLEARFIRGIEPAWYFVKVPLKDIKDEGPSPLVLKYNKIQIAANKGTSVYVDEDAYNKLPDDEVRAYLLMHEGVISAIGVELIKDGSQIREITGLLMNDNFMDFTAEELSRNIKKLVGNKESLLYQYAEMDISGSGSHVAGLGFEDVSTTEDGKSTAACLDATDQCVFKDTKTGLFWSSVAPNLKKKLTWSEAKEGCQNLVNWGGYSDWRLPSVSELNSAFRHQLVKVVENNRYFGPNTQQTWSETPVQTETDRYRTVNLRNNVDGDSDVGTALEWRCVRSDLSKKWLDMSVNKENQYSSCHYESAICRLKDKVSGIIWSSVSPSSSGAQREKKDYNGANSACASLRGGTYSWRLPTPGEAKSASDHGLSQIAARYQSGFGDLGEVSGWTSKISSSKTENYSSSGYWRRFTRVLFNFGTGSESSVNMIEGNYLAKLGSSEAVDDGSFKTQASYHYLCVQEAFSHSGADADFDGIPDTADKCPGTLRGVWVYPEGTNAGCSTSQTQGGK